MKFYTLFSVIIYSISIIILFSLILQILSTSVLQTPKLEDLYDSSFLYRNWNTSPIENLKLIKRGEECPLGWEELQLGLFYGTETGCDCTNEKRKYDYIISPSKNYQSLSVAGDFCNCKEVQSIAPVFLNSWGNNKICGTRAKEYSYFNSSLIKDKDSQCGEGEKYCGVIDTRMNKLCLPEKLNCPINYLAVEPEVNVQIEGFNYSYMKMDNGLFLIFSSNDRNHNDDSNEHSLSKSIILNEFEIIDDEFCSDSNLSQIYVLMRNQNSTLLCSEYYQSASNTIFKYVSSETKSDFYSYIGIFNQIARLPIYPTKNLPKSFFKLQYRNYFYYNSSCKFKYVKKASDFTKIGKFWPENYKEYFYLIEFFSIFFTFRFLLLNLLWEMNSLHDMMKRMVKLFLFIVGLQVASLCICVYFYLSFNLYNNFVSHIDLQEGCLEDNIRELLIPFQDDIEDINRSLQILMLLNILTILFPTVISAIGFNLISRCFKKEQKVKKIIELSSIINDA